jgi:hypothetical protein
MNLITIDQAIKTLQKAKRLIGGDKVLTVSLTGSGLEEVDAIKMKIVNDGDSQYIQLRVAGFEGIDQHLMYDDELDRRHGGDFDHTSPLGEFITKVRRR